MSIIIRVNMGNLPIGGFEYFKHNRGTVCVFRECCGFLEIIRLAQPSRYREYIGCFSIL